MPNFVVRVRPRQRITLAKPGKSGSDGNESLKTHDGWWLAGKRKSKVSIDCRALGAREFRE